jgi:hypothetical protein
VFGRLVVVLMLLGFLLGCDCPHNPPCKGKKLAKPEYHEVIK